MSDQKKMVKAYVRGRLLGWQRQTNEHLVRADLANLRRGVGKKPGDMLFPAHAGVILDRSNVLTLIDTFPRTRGGDPKSDSFCVIEQPFSPHTRG